MPLKRTPPSTPQEKAQSDGNQGSAPVTDSDNETTNYVSSGPRNRNRHDKEVAAAISAIKVSLAAFQVQQSKIQDSIDGIIQQNSEIMKSMEFISKQYEEMRTTLIEMETEKRSHLAYIQTLEAKVENLERSQKQASLEIRNVPIQKNETKDDLIKLVQKVGLVTEIRVDEIQIKDVFRLAADKKGNRPILVNFSSVLLKEKILTAVKTHNRKNQGNKFNTTQLQLGGQPHPIYIVESLTQNAKKIFYLAREFGKKNKFEFCWTAHGKVFLRQKAGAPSYRIDKESDFDKLHPKPAL